MGEKKGFTKFPNELLEKMMSADLSGRDYKILLSVIRYTLGFHNESGESLSISILCKMTGLLRPNASKAIKSLIDRNILLECIEPGFNFARVIAVNLEVSKWKAKKQTVSNTITQTVSDSTTQTVSKSPTHTSYIKENNKDNYKYKKNELKNVKKASYDLELFEQMLNSKD